MTLQQGLCAGIGDSGNAYNDLKSSEEIIICINMYTIPAPWTEPFPEESWKLQF